MIPTFSVKNCWIVTRFVNSFQYSVKCNQRENSSIPFNVNGRVKVMKIAESPLLSHQSSLITEMILKHGIFLLNQSTQ